MNTFILSRQKADLVSNAILKQARQYYLLFFVRGQWSVVKIIIKGLSQRKKLFNYY
jgi:hypothetical protein